MSGARRHTSPLLAAGLNFIHNTNHTLQGQYRLYYSAKGPVLRVVALAVPDAAVAITTRARGLVTITVVLNVVLARL